MPTYHQIVVASLYTVIGIGKIIM